MVVKETKVEKTGVWFNNPRRLAKEAVLHYYMNLTTVENFVRSEDC